MVDLNDLRVFERVAALLSFSQAAQALDIPRSSASRSVQRLEAELATQLILRTTREAALTEAGTALYARCADILGDLSRAFEYVGSLKDGPRGCLRISVAIGFGINVLGELLPGFLRRCPNVDVILELSSMYVGLVGDRIDVAIRIGPMPDSTILATRLGVLRQYLCASPEYLDRRGTPLTIDDLRQHDLVYLAVAAGRKQNWHFSKDGETVEHKQSPRVSVNDALTIHKLILNGTGIGVIPGYLCAPELAAGRLVRLFTEWSLPTVEVHAVFPNQRELSPTIRAFVDYMRENSRAGHHWQNDPLALD